MLTVKWELASGEVGENAVADDEKWTFGRASADEWPTVVADDVRISRSALTIRDSAPGPVVFRGQRGEGVDVVLVADDGLTEPIDEGTAANLREDAHRVELLLSGEPGPFLSLDVDFEARPTVRERQEQAEESHEADPGSIEGSVGGSVDGD